jgi:hypothetical protein
MSDNLRRYCAIQSGLKQLLPTEPTGNQARHLNTLAALVSGIIGSRKVQSPAIASKVPDGQKRESRSKRFARFLQNKHVTPDAFFLPYAQALLESLPAGPLVLIMDGSQVGRGCMVLMLSVLFQQQGQQRALPLCWLVLKAKKGHFAQARHRELVTQAQKFIAPGREVIFLGDGEFDGPELLAALTEAGWQYVCRTAKNALLCEADWPAETFSLSELCLQPGDSVELGDVLFTAQGVGPVLIGAVWEPGQKEPLLLVSNLDFLHEARFWYRKRFGIETFFCDQKSRGFYLCHSHLSDPQRLSRLLIATCLAYYWMVCLGTEVIRCEWQGVIHRRKRCDLSLFQLGMVWLEHCLNEGWHVPVRLQLRAIK